MHLRLIRAAHCLASNLPDNTHGMSADICKEGAFFQEWHLTGRGYGCHHKYKVVGGRISNVCIIKHPFIIRPSMDVQTPINLQSTAGGMNVRGVVFGSLTYCHLLNKGKSQVVCVS